MRPKLTERLPLIRPGQLEPGDVLLSRGCDELAMLIARLDGSLYSHAAIWTAEGVVEAVSDGILCNPLSKSLEQHPRGFMHVYRPTRPRATNASVAEVAALLATNSPSYAWGDLLLVSLVAWLINPRSVDPARKETWKIKTANALRALRAFLEQNMPEIQGILSSLDFDTQGCMTCSQLIATAFAHAEQPLRLTISGDRALRGEGALRGAPSDELTALRSEIRRLSAPLLGTQIRERATEVRHDPFRDRVVLATNGPEGYPPHLVTPRDVFSSPDLVPVGRLDLAALGFKHCAELTGNGDPHGHGYIEL